MIIKLYEIEDEIRVQGELDGSRFKRPEDTELTFLAPVAYDLRIQKTGEEFRVSGKVSASLSLSCARCLEDFPYSIETDMDIALTHKPKDLSAEVELRDEELDVCYFEGEEIEIDPYVYEEVILSIPLQALCSDACSGICPQCGKNRNREECGCEQPAPSVLGEKLKRFLNER